MAVSDKVKAMLNLKGRKIKDLAEYLELSQQSMRNKLNRGSFSAEDLIRVSMFLGAELSFKITENQSIVLDESDIR
jgi:lambda repressor-like predicted transcriptional regulator